MNRSLLHIAAGLAGIIIGGCLMLFTDGIVTPIITLSKLGVVLLVLGVADLVYGVYLAVAKKK